MSIIDLHLEKFLSVVISSPAALNFLKLGTLILSCNVSSLYLLYSFYSRLSKNNLSLFLKLAFSFIFYAA
jgi:hypothetical protein